jgi:hypothetical protein
MQGRKPAHPNLAHAGSHGLFRAAASGACASRLLRVSEHDERGALGSGPLGALS